jgi:peptidoglycan-associated lipoprotein
LGRKVIMKIYSQVRISRVTSFSLTLMLAIFAASCGGKKVPVPPPPPPTSGNAGSAPAGTLSDRPVVAEFAAEPSSIERGQSAQLRWNVTGSTDVSISNGIGTVPASGSRRITPNETTTYTLTAVGPNGSTPATATVSVTSPAPPPPPPTNTNSARGTVESRVQSDLQDVPFDYDSNNVQESARAILLADAEALKRIFADFPSATINVEGHCDERGSAEYNLGLGDRRASATREFLAAQGVPVDRLKTISYGKERPTCTEATESCYQRNRRAHFSGGQ